MAYWVDGIELPTKGNLLIREHTLPFSDDDFDSTDSFDILQDVLRSANTVRNYYRQLLAGVQNVAEIMLIHPTSATVSARHGNLYSELTSSR
jgi:ABC-type antimicrobial peptide transport system ATPase subunit